MRSRSSVRLIPERPVGLVDDALGFRAYARTLADAAFDAKQPLTIGVFGDWGTGKSSLMRMVADTLEEYDRIVTVEVNAWQFQHEDQPLFPLVASVVRRFDDYRSEQPRAVETMLEHMRRALATVHEESPSEWPVTQVSAAPEDMPNELDDLLEKSQYAKAFQLLSEVEVPQGWKFVVFIDDLDRCSPQRAVRLLESIKLVLDQPGFVFVLGISRTVIEAYINSLAEFDGSAYLDKLVQLPFQIPSYRERINNLASQLASKIDQPDLVSHLEMLASVCDYNPRTLIRVVNNLIIDRSINENLRAAKKMDEVPLSMFVVSRALQHRWPPVHRLLELSSRELAETVVHWQKDGVPDPEDKGTELTEDEKDIASAMRGSPELKALLHSAPGIEWLRDKDRRVAAAQFVRQHKRESVASLAHDADVVDAYISWPREHKEIAYQLGDALIENGFNVFLDSDSFAAGENLQKVMEESLQTARALVFLAGASTTTYQRQESLVMLDRQESENPPLIVTVVLPDATDAPYEKIPELQSYQSIDLRVEEPPFPQSTKKLIRALKSGRKYRTKKR